MLNKIIYITILVVLFTSCSKNEITREQAKELIVKEVGYPYVEYDELIWPSYKLKEKYTFYSGFIHKQVNLKEIIDNGLIDMKHSSKVKGRRYKMTIHRYDYSLSSKGKKLLWNKNSLHLSSSRWKAELPILLKSFKSITGLKYENEDQTKVTIEYKEEIHKSPFLTLSSKSKKQSQTIKTVTLELYDDGWRLNSKATNSKAKKKPLKNVAGWESVFKNYSI